MTFIDREVLLKVIDEMKCDEYIFGTNITMKQYFKQVINVIPYFEVELKGMEQEGEQWV